MGAKGQRLRARVAELSQLRALAGKFPCGVGDGRCMHA